VPVPEKDLPVELPYDVNFKPSGKSPLSEHEGFMNAPCPVCGKAARRDPDTLDTFVCSSWYFLRHPFAKMKNKPFDYKKINDIMPVDKYIGGAEHACMHLLYARFVTRALRDAGFLSFGEPFKSLVHQGMILGTDGFKMSKSRGNVVSPDPYVKEYGADVLRLYLLFGFSYVDGGPWNDDGIKSAAKFLERMGRLVNNLTQNAERKTQNDINPSFAKEAAALLYTLNHTIKAMTMDMEVFGFNTAVARLMELVNALYKYGALPEKDDSLMFDALSKAVKLLAPLAPKTAQKMWKTLGNKTNLMDEAYPVCDETALVKASVEIAVQINGKLRTRLEIPAGIEQKEVETLLLADNGITALLDGKPVKKIIVVPDRLANIII
jgi:leucyl-tRNA synthetase